MRRHGPINLIVYLPKTAAGARELSERVAEVHAAAVNRRIRELHCSSEQKRELLEAVIQTAQNRVVHKSRGWYSPLENEKEICF